MTVSMFLLVPAFTLGCVLTEIRWIVRMRKLQGHVGSMGENEYEGRATGFGAPVDGNKSLTANEETAASLVNLGQRLAEETPTSPFREHPATLKS